MEGAHGTLIRRQELERGHDHRARPPGRFVSSSFSIHDLPCNSLASIAALGYGNEGIGIASAIRFCFHQSLDTESLEWSTSGKDYRYSVHVFRMEYRSGTELLAGQKCGDHEYGALHSHSHSSGEDGMLLSKIQEGSAITTILRCPCAITLMDVCSFGQRPGRSMGEAPEKQPGC